MITLRRKPIDLFNLFHLFDPYFAESFDNTLALPVYLGNAGRPGGCSDVPARQGDIADGAALCPAVEVFTSKKGKLVLRAELPGVDPAKLEVKLKGKRLTIHGEKREEHPSGEDGEVHLREIVHGQFDRSFTLPDEVEPEKLTASYQDGVLEVTLPSRKTPEVRKISVTTSA